MKRASEPWGGKHSLARYGGKYARADSSYSLPALPSESVLHPGHLPDSNFEIPAQLCFALLVLGISALFISLFYGADWLFGV